MSETLSTPSGEDRLLANRYDLGEPIGHGGMADVYRGHDRVLDRTVAVKIFRSPDDAAARKRFADEGFALARLAHPGLVSIFDVGEVAHRPFLVMEFVDGESVRSRLLAGALSLAQTTRLGGMLADALAHAHHRDVVHRDVKPSNVMLDADDLPHLADFGIALLTDASQHTGANQIIGTPAYLAPEQLEGQEVGPAADVYALGLVLLECLTGEPEYASGTNLETALARLHRPPRIPEDLPPELAELLAAMTAIGPADRPAAETCAQRLLAAPASKRIAPRRPRARTLTASMAAVDPADRPTAQTSAQGLLAAPASKRAPRRPRPRVLAASGAGIAAILVALVVLLQQHQPPPGQASSSTGHAQRGTNSTSTAANPARPASGDSRPVAGTLVANEHPAALMPAATTPSTVAATPPQSPSTPPPTTTPSETSTPPPSTTSSDPPTTSSSPTPTSPGQE